MNAGRRRGGRQGVRVPEGVQEEMFRLFREHPDWTAHRVAEELFESAGWEMDRETARRYRKKWRSQQSIDQPARPGYTGRTIGDSTTERLLGYIVVPLPGEVTGELLTPPDGLQVLGDGPRRVRATRQNGRIVTCWLGASEEEALFDRLYIMAGSELSDELRDRYSRLRDVVCDYLQVAERHSFELAEGLASLACDELAAAVRGGYPPPDNPVEGGDVGAETEAQRVWRLLVDGRRLAGRAEDIVGDLRLALGL